MRGNRMGEFNTLELFRLWAKGTPQAEICDALGIRPGSFWQVKKRLKLPPRVCDRTVDYSRSVPPTPEEIAERAAAIRASWPEGEAEKRLSAVAPVRLRAYSFNRRDHAFSGVDSYSA